jgi:RNA polymerase sigma-B factor
MSDATMIQDRAAREDEVGSARDRRRQRTTTLWEQVTSSDSELERERLREEIVLVNLPVAQGIARRYGSRGMPVEDLEQVASLGLVKAVRGFDPARQQDFLGYAVPTVSGEVKRYFRDFGWTVRPPRRVQELQARINSVANDTAQTLGRDARPTEIAARLDVELSQVVESMTCRGAFTPTSLDAPVGEYGESESLGDLLVHGRDDYANAENVIVLRRAMSGLSPRDLLVLQRRFFEDRTQQQIGEEIGVSQMQVSRLLARILVTLRGLVDPTESDLPQTA